MNMMTIDTTEARTLFEIPAENMEKFEAEIAKLSRRSVKLGMDPITPFTFSHEDKELGGRMRRVYSVMLTAEAPRLNGWTFVARLDHANETGTIVRMVPNVGFELPVSFRHAATKCDHCNVNRYRRDTFVVSNDEGEFKQVGSTCLADFLGHDPLKVAKRAEMLAYAYECSRGYEQFQGGDLRYMGLEEFLGYAAYACRVYGWVSGKAAFEDKSLVATKERAIGMMCAGYDFDAALVEDVTVTAEDRALAAEALAFAHTFADKEELNNYEHTVLVIANASMIEPRSAGVAAAIVGVFFANRQRQQRAKSVKLDSFDGVIALMKRPGSALKFPKINLQIGEGATAQTIQLSIAGSRSRTPGVVNVTDGGPFESNTWFGKVTPEGQWMPSGRVSAATQASVATLLAALAADPAGTAAAYGRLTGKCCFCSKGLTDARSTQVGYGGTCAKNYGLPWGKAA